MGDFPDSKNTFPGRNITLNSLKDEMHSLNRRLLLAIQNHNQEAQEDLKKQMTCVQNKIDHMCAGGRLWQLE